MTDTDSDLSARRIPTLLPPQRLEGGDLGGQSRRNPRNPRNPETNSAPPRGGQTNGARGRGGGTWGARGGGRAGGKRAGTHAGREPGRAARRGTRRPRAGHAAAGPSAGPTGAPSAPLATATGTRAALASVPARPPPDARTALGGWAREDGTRGGRPRRNPRNPRNPAPAAARAATLFGGRVGERQRRGSRRPTHRIYSQNSRRFANRSRAGVRPGGRSICDTTVLRIDRTVWGGGGTYNIGWVGKPAAFPTPFPTPS